MATQVPSARRPRGAALRRRPVGVGDRVRAHTRPAATLVALAVLAGACTREAAHWPNRAVRMEVGYAVGQGTDPLAHVVAHQLGRQLQTPVIVAESRFAPGVVAANVARDAPRDGYTVLLGSSDGVALAPLLDDRLRRAIDRNLCPLALVAETPHVLVVSPELQVDSVEELIAEARRRPGILSYGSFGTESTTHAVAETFLHAAHLDVTHVPYRNSAAAVKDLLGGHLSMLFGTLQATLPALASGRLRALAVSSPERAPELPRVPTFAERGFGEITSTSWYGLFAPCGLTRDIEGQLAFAARAAVGEADIAASLGMNKTKQPTLTGEDFAQFIERERLRWMPIASVLSEDGGAAPRR